MARRTNRLQINLAPQPIPRNGSRSGHPPSTDEVIDQAGQEAQQWSFRSSAELVLYWDNPGKSTAQTDELQRRAGPFFCLGSSSLFDCPVRKTRLCELAHTSCAKSGACSLLASTPADRRSAPTDANHFDHAGSRLQQCNAGQARARRAGDLAARHGALRYAFVLAMASAVTRHPMVVYRITVSKEIEDDVSWLRHQIRSALAD